MYTTAELTTIARIASKELTRLNELIEQCDAAINAHMFGASDDKNYAANCAAAETLRHERNIVGGIYGKAVNACRPALGKLVKA